MYVWESEKNVDELLNILQSLEREYTFKIRHGTNFTLDLTQMSYIPIIGLTTSFPRLLKGTIIKKGTGSEITAELKMTALRACLT